MAKNAVTTLDFLNNLEAPTSGIVDLELDLIDPDPEQPRTEFRPVDGQIDGEVQQALEELADDIDANTLLQPISVREVDGRYIIIMGERRWRAFRLNRDRGRANCRTIPSIVRQDLVAAKLRLAQLSENIQRRDLSDLEMAKFLKDMLAQYPDLKKQELGQLLKKSSQYISRVLALLDPEWADVIDSGLISYASLLEQYRPLPKEKRDEIKRLAISENRPITITDIRAAKGTMPAVQERVGGTAPSGKTGTGATGPVVDLELAAGVQALIDSQSPKGENYQPSKSAIAPNSLRSPKPQIRDVGGDAVIPHGLAALSSTMNEKREARVTLQQLEVLLDRGALPNKKHQVSLMLPVDEVKAAITKLGGTLPEDESQLSMVLLETVNQLAH